MFTYRVGDTGQPFYVVLQFLKGVVSKKLRGIIRRMPQRFEQSVGNQNRNVMRGASQNPRRFLHGHTRWLLPQIQKFFAFLIHTSNADAARLAHGLRLRLFNYFRAFGNAVASL